MPVIETEIEKLTETIAKNRDGERLQAECRRKNDEIRRNKYKIQNISEDELRKKYNCFI